jgi:hypothetical protein
MRTPFSERSSTMGLIPSSYKGLYRYTDRYSEVVYRQLQTALIHDDQEAHETDGLAVPIYALYTKGVNETGYRYCGVVSDFYQFVGNEVLVRGIMNSIQQTGIQCLTQNAILTFDNTRLRNEIVLNSPNSIAQVGDVLPVIVVNNSYNGTKAASVSFGICTNYENRLVTFAFELGEIKQIHIQNSNTQLSSAVSSYMGVFTESIVDMVSSSMNSPLTEDDMLGTLDLIEGIGKRRRKDVADLLRKLNPPQVEGENPQLPSAWQMFLAIVIYSSKEPNLNSKRLLENAAESVLVVPTRMYEVLESLQSS